MFFFVILLLELKNSVQGGIAPWARLVVIIYKYKMYIYALQLISWFIHCSHHYDQ
jgi:hypothetical protein